jgi:ketosteroid isomerase-like protein
MDTGHDLLSIVRALEEACNAHDMDKVMTLFADDAVVRQAPPADGVGVYRGREQIRGWLGTQLPGFHVDSRDHQTNGDTVRWTARMSNDLLRQIGRSEPVEDQAEAVVREGKIASFSVSTSSLLSGL